mmetsp:Transcript_3593/g.10131  ORF Transcript_3593/g.10131 Transcript_3593/m.10131 type:complete len:289 (-) Transcript_3593:2229-3095(-)
MIPKRTASTIPTSPTTKTMMTAMAMAMVTTTTTATATTAMRKISKTRDPRTRTKICCRNRRRRTSRVTTWTSSRTTCPRRTKPGLGNGTRANGLLPDNHKAIHRHCCCRRSQRTTRRVPSGCTPMIFPRTTKTRTGPRTASAECPSTGTMSTITSDTMPTGKRLSNRPASVEIESIRPWPMPTTEERTDSWFTMRSTTRMSPSPLVNWSSSGESRAERTRTRNSTGTPSTLIISAGSTPSFLGSTPIVRCQNPSSSRANGKNSRWTSFFESSKRETSTWTISPERSGT